MGLRDIKAQARADLHQAMQVRAFYLATKASEPVLCSVRVHTKFGNLGDQKGTNFNAAETREIIPRLVFWRPQGILPVRNALVLISAEEGYRIGVVDPEDGLTITAQVSEISKAEMATLPVPPTGDTEIPVMPPGWTETEW